MSPINNPKAREMRAEMQKLAEGKISCACGNADWTGFLYVQGGPVQVMAGCKRCGRAHKYQPDGNWLNVGGPAPGIK